MAGGGAGRTSYELSAFCSKWSHTNRRKKDFRYEFKENKEKAGSMSTSPGRWEVVAKLHEEETQQAAVRTRCASCLGAQEHLTACSCGRRTDGGTAVPSFHQLSHHVK